MSKVKGRVGVNDRLPLREQLQSQQQKEDTAMILQPLEQDKLLGIAISTPLDMSSLVQSGIQP